MRNTKAAKVNKKAAEVMERHYSRTFEEHGATPQGVDWGPDTEKVNARHKQMAGVFIEERLDGVRILDIGCGYGAFCQYLHSLGKGSFVYTGIDVSGLLIEEARRICPEGEFLVGDFMSYDFGGRGFDYLVCSGIFTQKLSLKREDMRSYLRAFISRMNELSMRGFVFNTMSSHVNFRRRNLLYTNPAELMDYLLKHVSRLVKIDHTVPLYEYACYVYKR